VFQTEENSFSYVERACSKRWEVKGSFITRTRALTSTKNSLWNNTVKQEKTSSDWRLKINGNFRKEAREPSPCFHCTA
ncbi:hypothetical protein ACOI1C_21615, partial [Bacillus sp. DJP31]|uniref:hypothetical protein n=1 Tax=Bacillus sp. DJP31 TaxID=3409789 RepID=UPI003BB5E574